MVYLQEGIPKFPIIMNKNRSEYVVVPFRECLTSHKQAVLDSEIVFIFKSIKKFLKGFKFF